MSGHPGQGRGRFGAFLPSAESLLGRLIGQVEIVHGSVRHRGQTLHYIIHHRGDQFGTCDVTIHGKAFGRLVEWRSRGYSVTAARARHMTRTWIVLMQQTGSDAPPRGTI